MAHSESRGSMKRPIVQLFVLFAVLIAVSALLFDGGGVDRDAFDCDGVLLPVGKVQIQSQCP